MAKKFSADVLAPGDDGYLRNDNLFPPVSPEKILMAYGGGNGNLTRSDSSAFVSTCTDANATSSPEQTLGIVFDPEISLDTGGNQTSFAVKTGDNIQTVNVDLGKLPDALQKIAEQYSRSHRDLADVASSAFSALEKIMTRYGDDSAAQQAALLNFLTQESGQRTQVISLAINEMQKANRAVRSAEKAKHAAEIHHTNWKLILGIVITLAVSGLCGGLIWFASSITPNATERQEIRNATAAAPETAVVVFQTAQFAKETNRQRAISFDLEAAATQQALNKASGGNIGKPPTPNANVAALIGNDPALGLILAEEVVTCNPEFTPIDVRYKADANGKPQRQYKVGQRIFTGDAVDAINNQFSVMQFVIGSWTDRGGITHEAINKLCVILDPGVTIEP